MLTPTDEFTESIETLGLNKFEMRKLCIAVMTLGHTLTRAKQDLANNVIVELTGNMPMETFREDWSNLVVSKNAHHLQCHLPHQSQLHHGQAQPAYQSGSLL